MINEQKIKMKYYAQINFYGPVSLAATKHLQAQVF
jgi:hypothetical protein